MLKNWTSHAEYQQFIISNLSSIYKTFPKSILKLESSISKLYCLNIDILGEILKPSKSKSPVKNKKLPNKRPYIVKKIADFFYHDRSFARRAEKLLQKIFTLVAVKPSFELNLIQQQNLTITGDGTCVHCQSSYYGTKVCKCREHNIYDCKCDRKLADIDATWGWDSHENQWFYGYTLYALSSYNKEYNIDLPVYLRFVEARRHDSVTGVVALAEFRELLPMIKFISFQWIA